MAVAALSLTALAGTVFAGEPPFTRNQVTITARDQDINAFIREFYGAAGMSVTIASTLKGKINGRFSGPPAQVWARVSRAFNLVAYHDGSVVTVYSANEVASRAVGVPAGSADEVIGSVTRAKLPDAVNRVTVASADSVLATGVPRFLDQVQQLAGAVPMRPRPYGGGGRDIAPSRPPVALAPRGGGGRIDPYELRVFYLRYARADDTTLNAGGEQLRVPGVGSILSRIMGDGSPINGIQVQYGRSKLRPSQSGLRGQGLDSIGESNGQGAAQDDEYLGAAAEPAPRLQAAGYTVDRNGPRISTDPSLNAVIVRDRPENMPAYEGLVQALDVAPQIVELEATIIDLNIDRLRELGINWRFSSGDFSALFGGDIIRRTGDPAIDVGRTGSINRGLSSTAVIGNGGTQLIARIQALEEKGAARITSRPQLVTLSNVEAVFDRTRTFYVRVAGDRQVDLFNVTAGTMLRVNPHVLSENGQPRIRMSVSVEDGAILEGQVDNIPIVERASVNTQALIAEGESLLLGGLTVNSEIDRVSQLPLLADIPVLGNLFKTRTRQRQRTERLFLITPRITRMGPPAGAPAIVAPAAIAPTIQPIPPAPASRRAGGN